MELFERVREVSMAFAGSEAKLAAALGLSQQKLNGYMNEKSQRNLWEHLPRLLELYPKINRYWLYLGEGAMISDGAETVSEACANCARLEAENASLKEELLEVLRENRERAKRYSLAEEMKQARAEAREPAGPWMPPVQEANAGYGTEPPAHGKNKE